MIPTRTTIFANTTKRTCKVQLRLSWNMSNLSCVSVTCTQSTKRNDDQSSSEAVETKCDGFQPIKTIFTGYAVLVHICINMMSRNLRNVWCGHMVLALAIFHHVPMITPFQWITALLLCNLNFPLYGLPYADILNPMIRLHSYFLFGYHHLIFCWQYKWVDPDKETTFMLLVLGLWADALHSSTRLTFFT